MSIDEYKQIVKDYLKSHLDDEELWDDIASVLLDASESDNKWMYCADKKMLTEEQFKECYGDEDDD